MIVNRVELSRFMSYTTTQVLDLPGSGIVLVTGANGSGKSSIIEAVSVALFGKTLRGTPPWHDGVDCAVVVQAQVEGRELYASRLRSAKGKGNLSWYLESDAAQPFDTATKAQEALEHVVGEFDVWRRTSVFSSQDVAHFTTATDAERKRLLEVLLGLDRFEVALIACRKDLKIADRGVYEAQREHDVFAERVRSEAERRTRAEADLAKLEETAPQYCTVEEADAKLTTFDAIAKRVTADIAHANSSVRVCERKLDLAVDEVKQAEREFTRVLNGECQTCGRPWEDKTRVAVQAKMDAKSEAHRVLEREVDVKLQALRASIEELEEERASVGDVRSQWITKRHDAFAIAAERAKLMQMLALAVTDHDTATVKLAELLAMLESAQRDQGELAATERVLSLTGVRAKLLTDALSGIETIANTWLGRIAGWGMRLELKPYVEKVSGGVKDAIALSVHGAGAGFGYYAASAGQRRRIDVALLLALADIANASHGVAKSTLFVDECFDALDSDGADAVCAVLEELADDRPIVLITHNPALDQRLSKKSVVKRVHVDNGALVVT